MIKPIRILVIGIFLLFQTGVLSAFGKGAAVEHSPVLYAAPYEDLVITAKPFPVGRIKSAAVFFRPSGKRAFESVTMHESSDGVFSGVIPASMISTAGVLYYISARTVENEEFFVFASPDRPHAVSAQSLVVIQAGGVSLYEDVIIGLRKEFTGHIKIVDLNVDPLAQKKTLELLRKDPPEVVVTLGQTAAQFVRQSPLGKKTTVIYAMIADPNAENLKTARSTGVSFDIAPRHILETMKGVIPNLTKVGVVFDPLRTGGLVEEARSLAPSLGYQILASRIEESGELPAILRALEKGIDVFWLLPDSTVLSGQNLDALLQFSREFKVPIFAFSQELVRKGALLSVTPDYEDIGQQTGRLVRKVLEGTDARLIPVAKPQKMKMSVNMRMAKELKIENIAQQIVNYAADRDVPLRVFK